MAEPIIEPTDTIKRPNIFTVLTDFLRTFLVFTAPAASGILANANVRAGKRKGTASKSVTPGQHLMSDGKYESTGKWNIDVVLCDNFDANVKVMKSAVALFIQKAIRGENGGKIAADLQRRVDSAWTRVLDHYRSKGLDFIVLVDEFVKKETKKGAKKNILKLRFHGETAPDNHFFINANVGGVKAFQTLAGVLSAKLMLIVDTAEYDTAEMTPEQVMEKANAVESVVLPINEPADTEETEPEPVQAAA